MGLTGVTPEYRVGLCSFWSLGGENLLPRPFQLLELPTCLGSRPLLSSQERSLTKSFLTSHHSHDFCLPSPQVKDPVIHYTSLTWLMQDNLLM